MVHLLIHSHPASGETAQDANRQKDVENGKPAWSFLRHGGPQEIFRGDHPQAQDDPDQRHHGHRGQYHWLRHFCVPNGGVALHRKC